MNNNLCPVCRGKINDPDAENCPKCGYHLESFHYTFTKEEIEERLKTESPEIILELDKCPMCGTHRTNKEEVCSNCGFIYVPVGFRYKKSPYFDRGDDYIDGLFNKQISEIQAKDNTMLCLYIPLGLCVVLTFIIGSFVHGFLISLLLALIISSIVAVFLYNMINKPYDEAINRISSKQEEYKLIQKKWLKLNEDKEKSVYGTPDKSVRVGRFQRVGRHIYFYFEKGMLKYDTDFISIKDVLECSLDDECGGSVKTIGIVKNNTLDVVGRSVVGAAIGGATGAIIGGLTAQKHSEQIETTIHNYVVNISINNLKQPLIRLEFGKNVENAREVYFTLQAMLNNMS
jgi:hypothetical protein